MTRALTTAAGLVALLSLGGPAMAQQAEEPKLFGASSRVDSADLATITGRADTNMAIQAENNANVSNNSVNGDSQTGTISFDAAAFANLNGLSLLSANTGNNVAINSSLNVNVAIRP